MHTSFLNFYNCCSKLLPHAKKARTYVLLSLKVDMFSLQENVSNVSSPTPGSYQLSARQLLITLN